MLRRPGFWFLAVAIWFVALFVLSNQSHLQPPGPEFDDRDKVYHAGYFTLGSLCLFVGLRLKNPGRTVLKTALLVLLFAAFVGAFDEFHQTFIPNRSGNDLGDWLADSAGGILGSLFGMVLLCVPGIRMKQKQPCEP
ncbi:VanZ family protein [Roseimicrobium gellanilyticum]|uniref:VanZ family protein n=1 Tax=Roseimicrobium gellanilyticum TaxID=748857 RepID=A0A366HII4_9BACT|nr:VanZ family protein [Roseimicrobium gellanilyticum]RBP42472.1 VanZ family protein [Roseimicrobium gellanilyticum]